MKKISLWFELESALSGLGPLKVRRFRNELSSHGRWFVVKEGGLVRYTVEVRDCRPDPCTVQVAAPIHPSPSCTAVSAPGGWWGRRFTVTGTPRQAALCAAAAGFLMVGATVDGEWTCQLDGAAVEDLVRRREGHVAALLPREAYTLVSDVEACVREVMGLDVAEALARVRRDAELLAGSLGEDEWLAPYREAVVRKVHST